MYRKFREDPSSVDPSWHEFLVDYSPEPTNDTPAGNGKPAAAPTAPPEPAPAPAPKPRPLYTSDPPHEERSGEIPRGLLPETKLVGHGHDAACRE
ncbi:2-oxoglutarate dehydrogenase E1 subunit family protein, partial [Mycolicibacterium austroafricanum]|uniref:2-oxoglutarate dehydrogenase E1 subunit family protein n=1 Tax=Mycolicibacterium austroafricanum TaxID=39687 RepID=UPI003AF3CC54